MIDKTNVQADIMADQKGWAAEFDKFRKHIFQPGSRYQFLGSNAVDKGALGGFGYIVWANQGLKGFSGNNA